MQKYTKELYSIYKQVYLGNLYLRKVKQISTIGVAVSVWAKKHGVEIMFFYYQ